MARCRMYRRMMLNESRPKTDSHGRVMQDGQGNVIRVKTPTERVTICYNQASKFFQVTYSKLHYYRRNETSHEDTFGLCDECSVGMENVSAWKNSDTCASREGLVRGVRGLVSKLEVVNGLGDKAADYQKSRLMEEVKADFIRKMKQKNTASLSVDDWKELFERAIEDFIIMQVQDS